jgi:putative ABC transport system permease protein
MGTLLQDVRFGFRMMVRSPVVTAVAILSLALGITANAAMFSILNSFLFEALPYENQEELVLLRTLRTGESLDLAGGVSVPNFRDLVEAGRSIETAAVYTMERANLTGLDVPEQITVVATTPTLFDVLGVQPFVGRGFRFEEGTEGAGNVVVLEYDYWERRFFADRDVLGTTVTLDGAAFVIVGVMPADFDMLPANVHAFRPTDFADEAERRANRDFMAFARLEEGATSSQLQLELDAATDRLASEFPQANRGVEFRAQTMREFFPGPTDTQLLKILGAVTLFGLLIACANIANLLLGRAEERQREVAVRTAMGAGRGRILRQMLTESILMAVTAGVIGSVLAVWVVGSLRGAMPVELPAALMPELDPEVLGATLVVSVLAGVAFGLAPALLSVGGNLRESLGSGARGGTAGRRRKRARSVFVVGEIAVALALLSGSGFLIQAFDRLTNDDPGFAAAGLLTFQLVVLDDRYPEDAQVVTYQRDLRQALEAIPSVEAVAVMSSLPRGRSNPRTRYTVDGRPLPEPNDRPTAGFQSVNATYFATLDIQLSQGRLLDDTDREDAAPVAVVSKAFAAREFGDTDPLGKTITLRGVSRSIVGVVGDITQERMALAGRSGEQIYVPIDQAPLRNPNFALRTAGDPAALSADVRQAVWSVEADQPVAALQPLQAFIDESLAGPRSISSFLVVMGGIALALAAMGIYGVMAHSVMQQQREIGIRMALGAERSTVVGMIARSGLSLVAMGLIAGVPLALLMYRATMNGLGLFDTRMGVGYPAALSGALVIVAVVATVLPARRASGITPVAALKE